MPNQPDTHPPTPMQWVKQTFNFHKNTAENIQYDIHLSICWDEGGDVGGWRDGKEGTFGVCSGFLWYFCTLQSDAKRKLIEIASRNVCQS